MKRIPLVIVCILTIGTLIGGSIYWNHKLDATARQSFNKDLSPSSTNAKEDKKKTLSEIKKEYTTLFNELEVQETSKLDQLLVEAKAEYISKKMTKAEMLTKYQAALKQLEANADKSFTIIYQELQYDLERNGYDPKEAQPFQETYNSKKEDRAKRIANEIKKF